MSDIKFVDGLMIKPPKEDAPSFVKCSISIKRKDLGNWLRNQTDEWINLDVKVAKSGKWYAQVNDWKPTKDSVETPAERPELNDDLDSEIPF